MFKQRRLNLCVQMHSDKQLSGLKSLIECGAQGFFVLNISPLTIFMHFVAEDVMNLGERFCILETLIECPYTSG